MIRYGSDEGFFIDVLSKIGDAFSYDDLSFTEMKIEGHTVRIATVDTLYRLKEKTLRAIDQNDLIFLQMLKKRNDGKEV